jgi:hypothetical protein
MVFLAAYLRIFSCFVDALGGVPLSIVQEGHSNIKLTKNHCKGSAITIW